jgi:hypothetical protein
MSETDEMYGRVAAAFAARIERVFDSEDSMKQEFSTRFPALTFDRTSYWNNIIYGIVRDAWEESGPEVKSLPTGHDMLQILKGVYSLLDYNLFTQVYLNLQYYSSVCYRAEDAQAEIEKLKTAWPKTSKLDPFAPKAKMLKTAMTAEDQQFNVTLSTLRSLKIIGSSNMATGFISYRVSPKGSTPAFADSQNLSMLGVGADKYLRVDPRFKPFYLVWAPGTTPEMISRCENQALAGRTGEWCFNAHGIHYEFRSKSGGDILNEVLFARKLMYEVLGGIDFEERTCTIVPRMNSILIVTNEDGKELKQVYEGTPEKLGLKQVYPMLDLQEGSRV